MAESVLFRTQMDIRYKQKKLRALKKSRVDLDERINKLEDEISKDRIVDFCDKGGAIIFAGMDNRSQGLENRMLLKWEVSYKFRRISTRPLQFDITKVEINHDALEEYFGDLKINVYDEDLDVELGREDYKSMNDQLDTDDTTGMATGETTLEVYRKDPWTDEEIEEFHLRDDE